VATRLPATAADTFSNCSEVGCVYSSRFRNDVNIVSMIAHSIRKNANCASSIIRIAGRLSVLGGLGRSPNPESDPRSAFFCSRQFLTPFLDALIRPLFQHLVPVALVLYHLLKGTNVIFCFHRGFLIVHGGFGSAGLIGRTSPEHQGSCGTSNA
jgi:hypothetical protein